MPKLSNSSVVIGVLYVVFLWVHVWVLLAARQRVLATDGSVTSQEDWRNWRAEAQRQQDGKGPVMRHVPRSTEPPSLVLLRDYFATSLTVLLVLSSALYFSLALMLRGIFIGPGFQPDLTQDHERAASDP